MTNFVISPLAAKWNRQARIITKRRRNDRIMGIFIAVAMIYLIGSFVAGVAFGQSLSELPEGVVFVGEVSWEQEDQFLITGDREEYLRGSVKGRLANLYREHQGGKIILVAYRSLARYSANERENLRRHGWLLNDRNNAVLEIFQTSKSVNEIVIHPLHVDSRLYVPPAYREGAECGPDRPYRESCGFRGVEIYFLAPGAPGIDVELLDRLNRIEVRLDRLEVIGDNHEGRLRDLELWRECSEGRFNISCPPQQPDEPEVIRVRDRGPMFGSPSFSLGLNSGAAFGVKVPAEIIVDCECLDDFVTGTAGLIVGTASVVWPIGSGLGLGLTAGPGVAVLSYEGQTLFRFGGYGGGSVFFTDWLSLSGGVFIHGEGVSPAITIGLSYRF